MKRSIQERFFCTQFCTFGFMLKQLSRILILATLVSCNKNTSEQMTHQYTNDLIHETSPYLLQHAHNPVNWKAWNDETLAEARSSNKLILISVGYAACHWCHVMERESFEDPMVAQVMNEHYVNIKVDREERPDVDQVYMNAVQLLTGSGGWPLNVVALPDGRPIWGGTYFSKNQWISALNQLVKLYNDNPERMIKQADQLEKGIKSLDVVDYNSNEAVFTSEFISNAVQLWSQNFDHIKGGMKRAPKFMMPNNLHFLLRQAYQQNDKALQQYVDHSLTRIAYGGVFDHLGGGFSRYAVDEDWHVPHFEKMLYDNAQLVSLYSDAFLITKNPLYKSTVIETLSFIQRELLDDTGCFYSSLDADSETATGALEEGAFYVWTKEDLKTLLGDDYSLFAIYYNVNDYGYWEHDNYVLIRSGSESYIAESNYISIEELRASIDRSKAKLLTERSKRNRPRLDDKALTSWNALMLKGFVDAYRVFEDEQYLEIAKRNAHFIINNQLKEDGGLYHNYKNGKSTINGYLEDYATTIEAFTALYEVTLNQEWLMHSRNLTNYAFDHFFEDESKMFYFTSNEDSALVSRTIEYRDNVIPGSNSIMAKNLHKLSHYFDNEAYLRTAKTMLNNILPEMEHYPSTFSNWFDLMLNFSSNYYEVAVVGSDALQKIGALNKTYLPNKLLVGSTANDELPLLKNRYIEGKTLIYVCVNKACKLPVSEVEQAISLIQD